MPSLKRAQAQCYSISTQERGVRTVPVEAVAHLGRHVRQEEGLVHGFLRAGSVRDKDAPEAEQRTWENFASAAGTLRCVVAASVRVMALYSRSVDAGERDSHVSAVIPAPEVVLQARTERRRHLLVLDELRVCAVACRCAGRLGERRARNVLCGLRPHTLPR